MEELAWRRVSIIPCNAKAKVYEHKVRRAAVYRSRKGEWSTTYTVFDDEVGVVIPCQPHETPPKNVTEDLTDWVVVVPLEYYHHNEWRRVEPGNCYYLIEPTNFRVMGTCYDEERGLAERSCQLLGLEPEPDIKRVLQKHRRRRDRIGIQADMEEHERINEARGISHKCKRPKGL